VVELPHISNGDVVELPRGRGGITTGTPSLSPSDISLIEEEEDSALAELLGKKQRFRVSI
jgi:hypothetical protein